MSPFRACHEVVPLIKIRYADLPAGLHVRAEARGRSTIIYLLPGLTPTERRVALLRARRSANLGYGPQLSATGVATAVTVDQVKVTLRNCAVAFRAHPLLLFPPVIVAAAAMLVYIMLAAGTLTIREPQASGPLPRPGAALGGPRPSPSGSPGGQPGGIGGPAGPGLTSKQGPGRPGRSPRPSRSAGRSRSATPSASASPSLAPSPSPSSQSAGHPAPTLTPQSPAPAPSASPSPVPSESCLKVGSLGICLTV
jgi:hypothetical protein